MMRCHTYKGVYIPGCMGGAANGRSRCTCKPPPKRCNARRLEALADACDQLADAVKRLTREVRRFKKASPAPELARDRDRGGEVSGD